MCLFSVCDTLMSLLNKFVFVRSTLKHDGPALLCILSASLCFVFCHRFTFVACHSFAGVFFFFFLLVLFDLHRFRQSVNKSAS